MNIINDQNLLDIKDNLITEITRMVLSEELQDYNSSEISINFVNDKIISELNTQYRNMKGPTDVLSFSFIEDDDSDFEEEICDLGEIYISTETIKKQASEWNNTPHQELYYLLIHGLLHICGYDHVNDEDEKKLMFDKQDEYYNELSKLF